MVNIYNSIHKAKDVTGNSNKACHWLASWVEKIFEDMASTAQGMLPCHLLLETNAAIWANKLNKNNKIHQATKGI